MKLILPVGIIGICIGMYFIYLSPTVSEIKSLMIKKADYDQVILKSKEVIVKRDAISAEYNRIPSTDLDKLNKLVPETFNSVTFANDINSLTIKHSLSVKDFKIAPPVTENREAMTLQESGPYKNTVINIRLTGQYEQFVQFLKELETSLQLVDVTNLSIKTIGGEKSTDNSLEYTLEMNTYSLR